METQVKTVSSQRDQTLDILKAVAISLVVVGHVMVSLYPENYNENLIFKICYSFHMPLFIFIGGGVTALKSDEELMQWRWISSCFKRLMFPYIIWTIIYCLIGRRYDFINALFFDPILWYLVNLFICDLILFIAVHFKNEKIKHITTVAIYFFFFILYGLFRDDNLVIKNIAMFFPFYLVGHIIFRLKNKMWVKKLKRFLWIGALLYPVSMIFYTYKQYDWVITQVQSFFGISSHGGLIHIVVLFYNHFVVSTLGIMFIWVIVEALSKLDPLQNASKAVAYVGRYTMFIYVLEGMTSYVIADDFLNNVYLSGIFLVFARMALPLAIAYIFSFLPKLRLVLFGQ